MHCKSLNSNCGSSEINNRVPTEEEKEELKHKQDLSKIKVKIVDSS